MLYLMKRLKSQMQGGSREITKVAQTFSEIGGCALSCDYLVMVAVVYQGGRNRCVGHVTTM